MKRGFGLLLRNYYVPVQLKPGLEYTQSGRQTNDYFRFKKTNKQTNPIIVIHVVDKERLCMAKSRCL